MVKVKPGTVFKQFRKPMIDLLDELNAISMVLGFDITITSANDSKHMNGSKHYEDLAYDLRTRDLSKEQTQLLAQDIKARLGPAYDVVVEKDHIHVEYDN